MYKSLVAFALGLVSVAQASRVYSIDAIYPDSDPTCSGTPTYVHATTGLQESCEASDTISCERLEDGGYMKTTCTAGDPVSSLKLNPNEVAIVDEYETNNVDCSNEPRIRMISKIGACSNNFGLGWIKMTCDGGFQSCSDATCTQCEPYFDDQNASNGQCIRRNGTWKASGTVWSQRFTCPAGSVSGASINGLAVSGLLGVAAANALMLL